MSEIVSIFTCKTPEDIMEVGGSGWWKVDPDRVLSAGRVLLAHNANDPRQRGDQTRHGEAFLTGEVREVLRDEDGRCLISFERYAFVDGTFRWPGYRNPVAYMQEHEVLDQVSIGEWRPMEKVSFEAAQASRRAWDAKHGRRSAAGQLERIHPRPVSSLSFGEIISAHRDRLAEELGIEPARVRIVVET